MWIEREEIKYFPYFPFKIIVHSIKQVFPSVPPKCTIHFLLCQRNKKNFYFKFYFIGTIKN